MRRKKKRQKKEKEKKERKRDKEKDRQEKKKKKNIPCGLTSGHSSQLYSTFVIFSYNFIGFLSANGNKPVNLKIKEKRIKQLKH